MDTWLLILLSMGGNIHPTVVPQHADMTAFDW
jgi:hypothetical protein